MKVNSNDQLDLEGLCLSNCDGKSLMYTFNLYQMDSILKTWSLFTNNSYFYKSGLSYDSFVIRKDLFRDFPSQPYWKVELNVSLTTYADEILTASSSIMFFVNFSPTNGMCNLSPNTGTTNTKFTIVCANWIDNDGEVTSYSYYGKNLIFIFY